jgi:hypothetical protein
VQTAGPAAIEAMRNTVNFGRIGVSLRDSRPSLEALDRAARRLEDMLGKQVLPLENDISQAACDDLPTLLEPMAALPVQLRMLGLAGAERAQILLQTAQDLRGQDGTAAIGILGEPDCPFPADLAWARQAQAALDNGAGRDIERARAVVHEAEEVGQLFPDIHLVEQAERETLHDVLASQEFYARLADLRGVVPRVHERAAALYRDRLIRYEADLKAACNQLEELPDWLRLTDADREEIAGRLAVDLPPVLARGEALRCLKVLLVRQAGIAGLLRQLEQEVARRVPTVGKDPPQDEPVDLDLSAKVAGVVIGDDDQLREWLRSLEETVRNALAAGAPVRLRVRR